MKRRGMQGFANYLNFILDLSQQCKDNIIYAAKKKKIFEKYMVKAIPRTFFMLK